MVALEPTTKPFGVALADLLRDLDHYTTSTGNPNWHAFARELDSVHYETLRKAVAGERDPSTKMMEEVARALRIKPEHFAEYRIGQLQRRFSIREVGFDEALRNFEEWAREQEGRQGR